MRLLFSRHTLTGNVLPPIESDPSLATNPPLAESVAPLNRPILLDEDETPYGPSVMFVENTNDQPVEVHLESSNRRNGDEYEPFTPLGASPLVVPARARGRLTFNNIRRYTRIYLSRPSPNPVNVALVGFHTNRNTVGRASIV